MNLKILRPQLQYQIESNVHAFYEGFIGITQYNKNKHLLELVENFYKFYEEEIKKGEVE